jgi:hypothetical protein
MLEVVVSAVVVGTVYVPPIFVTAAFVVNTVGLEVYEADASPVADVYDDAQKSTVSVGIESAGNSNVHDFTTHPAYVCGVTDPDDVVIGVPSCTVADGYTVPVMTAV